jgi:hypothetical protein
VLRLLGAESISLLFGARRAACPVALTCFARRPCSEYTKKFSTAKYVDGAKPWDMEGAVLAFPCATQNEITKEDADKLVAGGVKYVFEGTPPTPPTGPTCSPAPSWSGRCVSTCLRAFWGDPASIPHLVSSLPPACRCQHALYSRGY